MIVRYFIALFIVVDIFALEVEQLFNIELISVKKEQILESKEFYGYSKIDESKIYDINLRFDGFISNLNIDREYQFVEKNQRLFDVYSQDIYLAQSELVNSKGSLNRNISKKLELLGIDKRVIKSINRSKKVREYLPIYSKYRGFVIDKKINSGSFAKKGSLLYRLADFSSLWVIARVYEDDIAFVKETAFAKVKFDSSDEVFSTKVDFIYPKVDKSSKTIDIRLIIDNNKLKIYPESFAKVEFFKAKREALTLPKSAIITKGDKFIVFVKGEYEGEFEPKVIEAKRLNSDKFEIIKGLNEGDSVVNKSLFLFDSDAQINGLY